VHYTNSYECALVITRWADRGRAREGEH